MNIIIAVYFIILSHLAGIFGTLFTIPNIPTWYAGLNKPFFSPPNWIFGPVWLTLYTLMGIAAYMIWRQREQHPEVRAALGLFYFQLILNALWSWLFFGAHRLLISLIEIIGLLVVIIYMMRLFKRINVRAGNLILPYVLWVGFAALLNGAIWFLN